jgi:NADH:ubiquinone oxidoreductase subunit E
MISALEAVPAQDPLAQADQRALIDEVLRVNAGRPGATMVVLNELQSRIGHVSPAMQRYVARRLQVPLSAVHGVVTFYSFFTTQPRGRHTVKFCMGTACYVGGTPQLIEKAKQVLGIDVGQTTPDGAVTIELCRCVGACSQAPVVTVDDEVSGRVRPNKLPQVLRKAQDAEHGRVGGKS